MNPGKLLRAQPRLKGPRSTTGPGWVGRVEVSRVSSTSLKLPAFGRQQRAAGQALVRADGRRLAERLGLLWLVVEPQRVEEAVGRREMSSASM